MINNSSILANTIDVSIIIPCKNEVNNLKWTVDSIIKSKNSLSFEILVVDDASEDKSSEFLQNNISKDIYKKVTIIKANNVGAAEARNIGAKWAKGNYLFFCDAHVEVTDGWLDKLVNTLKTFNADLIAPYIADMSNPLSVGRGQTWTKELKVQWLLDKLIEGKEIPIACGCAFGITKEAFDKIDGFNHLFQVWGKEDEELCLKAWLYGYKIVINPNVTVRHLFRKKHPYTVTKSNVIYNMLCIAYSHFGEERLEKTIKIAKKEPYFFVASEMIKKNKELILNQREKHFKNRIHHDDFFFNKFNILF